MKEQVSMHELFQIKKFQAEYITWKNYALPWFDLKSRRELKTVFKIGVLTRDFIAYEANSKLYCSKFNMEQLVHMALPGNESFHMLQQDTAEKKGMFHCYFYIAVNFSTATSYQKLLQQEFTALIIGCPTAVTHSVLWNKY